MTKVKSGYGLPPDRNARRAEATLGKVVSQDFGRGVLGMLPLQDVTIGTDAYIAAIDMARSMPLAGIAVQASDAALGTLQLALYRASSGDVLPGSWKVRRGQVLSQAVTATMTEYLFEFSEELVVDPKDAAWMVALLGSTATMKVRGSSSYTLPSFSGWKISPGNLPAEVTSGQVARTLDVPSFALLSPVGVRLRGTGT